MPVPGGALIVEQASGDQEVERPEPLAEPEQRQRFLNASDPCGTVLGMTTVVATELEAGTRDVPECHRAGRVRR